MATPNAHALLSASGSHRWLKCTASPRYEQGFPDSSSTYADEGTLAHSICELHARKHFTPMTTRKFNSELKKLQANPLYDAEMLQTAAAYVEFLTEKAMEFDAMPFIAFEQRVDFSGYVPHGFGTCDCIMIGGDRLSIIDYKHGKGVAVSAVNNSQMRLYALGALSLYMPVFGDAIQHVSMNICQPRLTDGCSEEVISTGDIFAWGEMIKPIALEAYNGPGTFCPGEHCRFCKGKAQCRARAEANTAFADFKDCIPAGRVPEEQANLTAEAREVIGLPPVLSDDEVGRLLVEAEGLVNWYKDLQEYASGVLLKGGVIPGWKMVAGKSNRTFRSQEDAFKKVVAAGYDEALLYERKPITLTAVEKLMGKKLFAEVMDDEVYKPLGNPTLVPESDKRQPYGTAAADFEGVTVNG